MMFLKIPLTNGENIRIAKLLRDKISNPQLKALADADLLCAVALNLKYELLFNLVERAPTLGNQYISYRCVNCKKMTEHISVVSPVANKCSTCGTRVGDYSSIIFSVDGTISAQVPSGSGLNLSSLPSPPNLQQIPAQA